MTRMRASDAGANVTQLSNSDGTASWEIKDSDGFTVFKVDSKGKVYTRGGVTRI